MWVEPLANGKYKAVERYIDPLSGKTKKISIVIEKDSKQARNNAQRALQEKIEEKCFVKKSSGNITLKELAEKYSEWQKKEIKYSSYSQTEFYTNLFNDIIGQDTIVSNLNASTVSDIIRKQKYSDYKTNRCILYFKAMMNWGYAQDLVEDVQWLVKIKRTTIKKNKTETEQKYLERDELKTVIEALHEYEHWQLATKFLALSGLRIGEMMALEDSDVDDEGIRVTKTYHTATMTLNDTPKTESSNRVVYIQPELQAVIKQIKTYKLNVMIKTGKRPKYFFPNYDGEVFSYDGFQKRLKKISLKAIGRPVNPHMLRHTHVSLLAEEGVPLEVISRRLGHHDSAITKEIYLHITQKRKERENEMIASVKIL